MHPKVRPLLYTLLLLTAPCATRAQVVATVDAKIHKVTSGISDERIAATLKRLEAFGTRNSLSSTTDPEHGVGAARKWLFAQFQSYSPRLEVRYDTYHVKKRVRIVRDTDFVNVVATLPGTLHPERQILVTAHYDSLAIVRKPKAETPAAKASAPGDNSADAPEGEATANVDWEKTADAPVAPGVTDDGSGVAAVLEMARVMSQFEFENTIIFIAFAGEEQGLIGSNLYAAKAKAESQKIVAVLNNDIIGSDISGDGRRDNRTVNVYSADPIDSPSRSLARYVKDMGEKYLPSMTVNLVFRDDRFARGGDHTPFSQQGFAAVRLTTPTENFSHQHNPTDTFENTSPSYIAQVAKINAAAIASLGFAPPAPIVTREVTSGEAKGRLAPRISRGKSGYDAVLRWSEPVPNSDVAGYVVVARSTLSPYWEKEIPVGNVDTYTLANVSIDNIVLGVKALGKDGAQSLVSPYVMVPRPQEKIDTN